MASPPISLEPSVRRARYRDFMRAFNPTAPPSDVLAEGLTVPDLHDDVHLAIARRAEIEPGAQQLVLGGTGSGKTTLLLQVKTELERAGIRAFYFDVAEETDLRKAEPGSLVAIIGLALASLIPPDELNERDDLKEAHRAVRAYANGRWEYPEREPDFEHDGTYFVPGKLSRSIPSAVRDLSRIKAPLALIVDYLSRSGDIVVLFDGLDRLGTVERFRELVESDSPMLLSLRVGTVVAGPLFAMFEDLSGTFGRVREIRTFAHSKQDPRLARVIEARDRLSLLEPKAVTYLCNASGGVLRDLITLCRDAAERAFLADGDSVSVEQARYAEGVLGDSYLRALKPPQVSILRSVMSVPKKVDFRDPEVQFLLLTRRILRYDSATYRVHPAAEAQLRWQPA